MRAVVATPWPLAKAACAPALVRRGAPLLLSLAALAALLGGCSRPPAPPEPVRAVRLMVVGQDSATASHEFAAEVRARTESALGFRVGGKLLRRSVEAGDAVKAGQVLAQLDATDLQLGQDAAQAGLRAAQAALAQAQADLQRARELQAQNFIGAAQLEARETAVQAAQASLDQARAQAQAQGNQAGYARLTADAGGIVTAVLAEPGMVLGAGTPVLRLAHDGPRDLVFQVPEDRVAAVRALRGQAGALQVSLWGQPGEPLRATVREVGAAADPVTRTFQVKADAGRAELRLGQTATVRMPGPTRDRLVRLPLAALTEQGGRSVAWVLDEAVMTVKPVPVLVAGADGRQVLVADGLKPGMQVVTAGVHVLSPGQKVRRYVEPGAAASVPAAVVAASR